ncbi:hypothetical protein SAMN05421870_1254 [Streptomyces qinglanensis]|uniref:Uncharacterized protein n=1 Tax=Streptomyces qinglanensis TaxID=943816 RepID=A0A1H9WYB1_9ACTN|nr:hypothetical protein SAMN05421870_1254 [Streptomyces qinglanensis]
MAAASPVGREADATHRSTAVGGLASGPRKPLDADALMRLRALVFRDQRLSFRAKGLFGLITTPEFGFGGATVAERTAEYATDSVAAARAALGELEEFGYLVRDRPAEPGGSAAPTAYVLARTAGAALLGASGPDGGSSVSGETAEHREAPSGGGVRGLEPTGGRGRAHGGSFLVSSRVQEVLLALPDDLRKALRATARTDRPRALVAAVERELHTVSSNRLVERIRRRWVSQGYGRLLAAGALKRPVGAAVALVRAGPCPDPRCEDGRLEDGTACRACAEREKDRRAEHARRGGQQQDVQPPPCAYCGAAPGADGEPCDGCARASKAVDEEVAELVEVAVRAWAAVPGTSVAEAREAVGRAVARARTDAAEAGAAAAGQALAARLAALEEAGRARMTGRESGGRHRADLGAASDRLGHVTGRPLGARAVARADSCPGTNGSGCPGGRAAMGSDGLCLRCRAGAGSREVRDRGQ